MSSPAKVKIVQLPHITGGYLAVKYLDHANKPKCFAVGFTYGDEARNQFLEMDGVEVQHVSITIPEK